MSKQIAFILALTAMLFFAGCSGKAPVVVSKDNATYKSKTFMLPYDDVFEAVKITMMKSNLNLITVSKESGVIFGKGMTEKKDEVLDMSITVNLKSLNDNTRTHLSLIANYQIMEEQSDTSVVGAQGISFPIPVPWGHGLRLIGTQKVEDPRFFFGFFRNVNKTYYENEVVKIVNKETIWEAPKKEELVKTEEVVQEPVVEPKPTQESVSPETEPVSEVKSEVTEEAEKTEVVENNSEQ